MKELLLGGELVIEAPTAGTEPNPDVDDRRHDDRDSIGDDPEAPNKDGGDPTDPDLEGDDADPDLLGGAL